MRLRYNTKVYFDMTLTNFVIWIFGTVLIFYLTVATGYKDFLVSYNKAQGGWVFSPYPGPGVLSLVLLGMLIRKDFLIDHFALFLEWWAK